MINLPEKITNVVSSPTSINYTKIQLGLAAIGLINIGSIGRNLIDEAPPLESFSAVKRKELDILTYDPFERREEKSRTGDLIDDYYRENH